MPRFLGQALRVNCYLKFGASIVETFLTRLSSCELQRTGLRVFQRRGFLVDNKFFGIYFIPPLFFFHDIVKNDAYELWDKKNSLRSQMKFLSFFQVGQFFMFSLKDHTSADFCLMVAP